MNHKKFIDTYLGTFQREKGMSSAECVALSKLYAKEVQWYTLGSFWGSALSGWNGNTFDPKYWKRVKNTPSGVPKQWDHIFFGQGMWPYGHVAIVNTANVNTFTVVEQNHTGQAWDVPWDEIRLSPYDYKNVLGWFTPVFQIPTNEDVVIEKPKYWEAPLLENNTFKVIPNYHQKINGHCTFFAAFTAMAYNTGKVFKSLRVQNTASLYCNPAYPPELSAKVVCDEFWLKYCVLKGEEAEKVLAQGYALIIAIVAPTEMIADWTLDGVIDWKYNRDISKSHALCVIKEKDKYLLNSLGDYVKKGYYNKYKISEEQLTKIMKWSNQILIYP